MPSAHEEFQPAWWCRSAHAQTIFASTLRSIPAVPVYRERWDTSDGDFLEVDHLPAAADQPILIILHGLEGSSRANQARGFLRAAHQHGWRALAVNFRSCGGTLNRLRRSYHAGDTSDLHGVITRATAQYPRVPIYAVGMSLGGNVLLKYLGEQGSAAPTTLNAAVAISTPFDLALSARAFEWGFFNHLYMNRLLQTLKHKTLMKLTQYPDLVDRKRLLSVRTIRAFDELVTAPVHGFPNAADYWTRSSCRQFLASIRRPTLLISAADDPLVPFDESLRQDVARNPSLSAAFPNAGGHVGFVGGSPACPSFWAEERAFDFFKPQIAGA